MRIAERTVSAEFSDNNHMHAELLRQATTQHIYREKENMFLPEIQFIDALIAKKVGPPLRRIRSAMLTHVGRYHNSSRLISETFPSETSHYTYLSRTCCKFCALLIIADDALQFHRESVRQQDGPVLAPHQGLRRPSLVRVRGQGDHSAVGMVRLPVPCPRSALAHLQLLMRDRVRNLHAHIFHDFKDGALLGPKVVGATSPLCSFLDWDSSFLRRGATQWI